MLISVIETPNPNSVKLIVGKVISVVTLDKIKQINGIVSVFTGDEFYAVSKHSDFEWESIIPEIKRVIADEGIGKCDLTKEDAVNDCLDDSAGEQFNAEDIEIVAKIKNTLTDYIIPFVSRDGGYIKFRGYKEGVVFVELQGACAGCPGAAMTLKNGVCSVLRSYVEEVVDVEAV